MAGFSGAVTPEMQASHDQFQATVDAGHPVWNSVTPAMQAAHDQFQNLPAGTKANLAGAGGGGGGDSQLTQLQKMAQAGGLNPAQQAQLNALLAGQGGGTPNYDDQINALYNPAMQSLDTARGNVQTGFNEDVNQVGGLYNSKLQGVNTEAQQNEDYYGTQQKNYNQTIQSALSDAIRAYKAIEQQRQSRFGGGSSAGQAVGELAQQEFFRQQGGLNQEQARGNEQFGLELNKLHGYISQKKTDLDNWKQTTIDSLNQNFRNNLAAIDGQKGQIESAKAASKLQLLQDTVARAQQVQDADKQYRQQLAVSAFNSLSGVAGSQFTPAQIQAQVQNIMGSLGIGASTSTGGSGNYIASLPGTQKRQDDNTSLFG